MTTLAPALQAFFVTRLGTERDVSPHTVDSYRHTFQLLLTYAKQRTGKAPSELEFGDLDAALVSSFLDHLEHDRGCGVGTRNTRLAAIHSFFRYASYRHPEHAATIQQVLAIPQKKAERRPRSFLTTVEMEALLAAPDRNTWSGRRDHVLLALALQTGLRLSELTGLRCQDVELGTGAHVKCLGKGRKRRDTPLDTTTVSLLRAWLKERGGKPDDPLFPSRQGGRMSSDAVQRLVTKHVATARASCPSLEPKRITAHNLRHSCAMDLQGRGVASDATFPGRCEDGVVGAAA
jgi:integrase/recombinase XerD